MKNKKHFQKLFLSPVAIFQTSYISFLPVTHVPLFTLMTACLNAIKIPTRKSFFKTFLSLSPSFLDAFYCCRENDMMMYFL